MDTLDCRSFHARYRLPRSEGATQERLGQVAQRRDAVDRRGAGVGPRQADSEVAVEAAEIEPGEHGPRPMVLGGHLDPLG